MFMSGFSDPPSKHKFSITANLFTIGTTANTSGDHKEGRGF